VEVGRFIPAEVLPRWPLREVDSSCECARMVGFLRFGLEPRVSRTFYSSLSAFSEIEQWAMALYLAVLGFFCLAELERARSVCRSGPWAMLAFGGVFLDVCSVCDGRARSPCHASRHSRRECGFCATIGGSGNALPCGIRGGFPGLDGVAAMIIIIRIHLRGQAPEGWLHRARGSAVGHGADLEAANAPQQILNSLQWRPIRGAAIHKAHDLGQVQVSEPSCSTHWSILGGRTSMAATNKPASKRVASHMMIVDVNAMAAIFG
jgi:hypothetical protein